MALSQSHNSRCRPIVTTTALLQALFTNSERQRSTVEGVDAPEGRDGGETMNMGRNRGR
eukprot:COSAG02_NODE_45106_length_360_cov_0.766284_1_plen_58_part_01